MTLAGLARLLDGKVTHGKCVVASMPWPVFRQVRVSLSHQAPDGIVAVPNRPGDVTIQECREYGLERLQGIL